MDANDAVIVVGKQMEKARDKPEPCSRLVVRDGVILIVGYMAHRRSDIEIDHLSQKDLMFGPSTPKWNHIENRIRDLILEGAL